MDQKPRRIYGIDAADVPPRFSAPSTHSSSFGSNGHYTGTKRPSDEIETNEPRRRVFGQDSTDPYPQRPYGSSAAAPPTSTAPSYSSQSYGYNAPPPQPSGPQSHHYQSSADMERSSRYDEYNKHRGWSNAQPPSSSSMGHGGPAYGVSTTSSSRTYSRAQSPDIKPPSWYQDYANSVPPKPQTQPAYQQRSDSGYYGGGSGHHQYQQQQQQHHGYGGSSSLAGIHEMDEDEEDNYHQHRSSNSSSQRSSKAGGMGSSPSVHPFDTADPMSTSSSSSKSKKPKRIKNAAGQEDMIVMDDEFYAVKAKRKRANASQLSVLNAAFERSYFPSTEERLRLSKQCRMCPRTVQIWFQNKRQSVKARSEAMDAAMTGADGTFESRMQMLEEEASGTDGQKRSMGDSADQDLEGEEESGENGDKAHHRHHHRHSGSSSKQRRESGNNNGGMTPSDAVMSALHIQLDGRSVDYFSRKRRATIAKMERNEQQKKEKEELQRKREQEQQLLIQQYQQHQQEQVAQQRLQQQQQQQQQEGQTVGQS
ncbi:hypothetical protein BGX33_007339 [Mortierella sp. NVP41]|nr:hypothetical protein BGX33_007339 [Mortierella sp. NVP41]